ncbi:MAG: hypothetical protein A2V70_00375 [Planctomycetes bacterium RBG_13_63_9]|nr:MAG: hypothetical protein A2V70_00375 [Planctomycetes bacterium RBG_13_63_9]
MYDQANRLRQLVRDSATQDNTAQGKRPSLIVVASGKGGVGTTTVAVNLAVSLTRDGLQTVLVDANPRGGDVAILCGLEERYTLADVLSGQRTINEALQRGPAAVQVLPGVWGAEGHCDEAPAASKRLIRQLHALGGRAELVVVDAGNTPDPLMQRFWQTAELILLVTSPEDPSIVDTYALIKALAENDLHGSIQLLVNLCPNTEVAESVYHRLAEACRRFLGVSLESAGHVPVTPRMPNLSLDSRCTATTTEPLVIAAPDSAAAAEFERLAKTSAASLADERVRQTPPPDHVLQRSRMTA